jgi:hypothetical protein
VESLELTGLLAARGLKLLKYVDPAIAGVAMLLIAVIVLGFAARCVFIFVSLGRYDSNEDKISTVVHGVGYLFFAGVCFVVSLVCFAESQSNPDSIAFGMLESLGRPKYPTPGDFEPGQGTANPGRFRPLGEDRVEVRQPNRNRPLDNQNLASPRLGNNGRPSDEKPNVRLPEGRLNLNKNSDSVDVRQPPGRTNSPVETALPASAQVALPKFEYSLEQAQKSNFVGTELGQDFRGHGPAGSVLVGMRFGTNQGRISGFEPIYQLEEQYVTGTACGNLGDSKELVLAKPGYVVGGALVAADSQSLAVQLRFVKYNATQNALDTFDQYDSNRIGRSTGPITELDGRGAMVVGVFGKLDGGQLCGMGVAGLKPSSPNSPASSNAADTSTTASKTSNGANVFRVWFSKDRKFSVEAKLREIKDGKVVLEKRDGLVVEVDRAGLCDEDDKYLTSR